MSVEHDARRGPDRRRRPRGGRRDADLGLRDPDICQEHAYAGRVIDVIHFSGLIVRKHKCPVCDLRWESYQTVIDPRRIQRLIRLAKGERTSV